MSDSPPKAFLRPGKVFLLTLTGLFIYLGALVFLVPAGWLWQQARGSLTLPPEVRVEQVSGHWWQGVAGLDLAGFPVRAEWVLGAPSLSDMALPVDFSVSTAASSIRGDLLVNSQGDGEVHARGTIAVSEFEPLIRRSGGALIEGNVSVEQLNFSWSGGKITALDGLARWPGGAVTWPMGDGQGRADFPPMQATLDSAPDGITLVVAEEGADGPAAQAVVGWNGMMDIRVHKRMVDLARQPWPDSAAPGDIIFRVRQPLVPGGIPR